jgi:CubicO group peptidase (beta-lactamase class C family)
MAVEGHVEPGWERVAATFTRSFESGAELGASVAVLVDGVPVVDLWGGVADATTGRPWLRDTSACVFSTTKGIAAICAHLLVQRGELDLDAPVARYWPEFAGGGKAELPVRWLLTHQAGLTFVDQDLTLDDLRAVEPVLRALEAQVPLSQPGAFVNYHAVTFGHLVGEVVRRVTGKTLGRVIDDELVAPLGIQAWLGLPEDADIDLALLEPAPAAPDPLAAVPEPLRDVVARFQRSIHLGGALPDRLVTGEPGDFNDRRVLAVELGGSNLVSNARSLARVYGATVSEVDGVRLLSDATAAECAPARTTGCLPFGLPEAIAATAPTMHFGLGFQIGEKLGPTSFGHAGAGGSVAFADLASRAAFAYVPNRMGADGDTRATDLIDAVRECLAR